MEAKELRVGNAIIYGIKFDRTPNILKIIAIEESKVLLENRILCALDRIKPIPLTEEWLLKLGFTYNEGLRMHVLFNNPPACEPDDYEDSVYHNVDFYYNGECFGFEVSNEWGENGNLMMSKIKYVHQLQNLYFELTGEELTFKK